MNTVSNATLPNVPVWYSEIMMDDFDAEHVVESMMSDMRVYTMRDIVMQLGHTSYTDQERNDIVNMFNKMGASSKLAYVGENRFRLKAKPQPQCQVQEQVVQQPQVKPSATHYYDPAISISANIKRYVISQTSSGANPNGVNCHDVVKALGVDVKQASKLLSSMVQHGKLRKTGFQKIGCYGRPLDHYASLNMPKATATQPRPVATVVPFAAVQQQAAPTPVQTAQPAAIPEQIVMPAKKQYSIAQTIEIQAIADEHFAGDLDKAKKIYEAHKQLNA